MTTLWRIGVDWDGDDFFNWDARPGDTLNLMTNPVNWSSIPFVASGAGGSDSQGAEATDYGANVCTWTSGTANNGALTVGNTTTRLADLLTPSTAYTLVFWIKSNSASYDAVPLDVTVFDQAANSLVTSANFTVTFAAGWTKIAVNFTLGAGDTGCYFTIRKDTSTTNAVYKLAGFMVILGTYTSAAAPGFNAGDSTNLYDNLVPYAMAANWNIGARAAYVDVADLNALSLTLNNTDKIFSPENLSSPLVGSLFVNSKLAAYAYGPSSSSWTLMFTGYVEAFQPLPLNNGAKTATVRATSSRRYFEGKEITIALQTSVDADALLTAIFAVIDFPPGVGTPATSFDNGGDTWPYAGENWDDGVDPLQAIADTVGSNRGFFYWNRSDTAVFKNRDWRYDTDTVVSSLSATFDNTFEGADYVFGDIIRNIIYLTYYPRKLGSAGTQLFDLPEDIPFAPLETETIICRFTKGDRDKPIGASGATVSAFVGSGTLNHVDTFRAQEAEIAVTNPSAVNTRTLQTLTITGTPILPYDAVTLRRSNSSSVLNHGEQPYKLDLKFVSTRAEAKEILDLEEFRFQSAVGRMRSITIGKHDSTREQNMVDLVIGQRIRVVDGQTEHDDDYIIVGEEHSLNDALTVHKTTYYLEKVVDLI